jgi:Spy/CpxP family protein refolding chaperone
MNKTIVATLLAALVLALIPLTGDARGPVAAPVCTPSRPVVITPEARAAISQARYFDGTYSLAVLQRRLKLTKQQRKEMQSLYNGFTDQTRDARTNLISSLDQKKAMLKSGTIDEKKLADLDDQIVKLRSDIFRDRLKLVRDRLALLTPAQTQRLAHLKARMVCRANIKAVHGKSEKI